MYGAGMCEDAALFQICAASCRSLDTLAGVQHDEQNDWENLLKE